MDPESVQKGGGEIKAGKTSKVSWPIMFEGIFFGFLSMLVAEEPVLNWMIPTSWLFFVIYLTCRCRAHYLQAPSKQLDGIRRIFRIWAWILISGATVVSTVGQ
jgi:hypothetical protein